MNRQLKILAAISVLLNLLLLGIIFGHAGQYFVGEHTHGPLLEMANNLPAAKRPLFENTMKRAEQDTDELRSRMNDERQEAAHILQAEKFDKQAYMEQMQRIQKLRGQMMTRMAEAMADVAAQCTPAERVVLADMVRNPPYAHSLSKETGQPKAEPKPAENKDQ